MTTVREDNRTNPLPRPPNPEFSPSNSLSCFFYFPTCFSIMYSYCYFFSKLLLLVVVFLLPIMEEEVLALPCHPMPYFSLHPPSWGNITVWGKSPIL